MGCLATRRQGSSPSIRLEESISLTAKADGSLIVATTRRLLRVIPATKKVEVLLDHTFWGGLYPNSMIITPDDTIYLGMRYGVAKIEKKGESHKCLWLLPNK